METIRRQTCLVCINPQTETLLKKKKCTTDKKPCWKINYISIAARFTRIEIIYLEREVLFLPCFEISLLLLSTPPVQVIQSGSIFDGAPFPGPASIDKQCLRNYIFAHGSRVLTEDGFKLWSERGKITAPKI